MAESPPTQSDLGCGKRCLATEQAALDVIRSIRYRNPGSERRLPVRPYYCERCGAWHVTSMLVLGSAVRPLRRVRQGEWESADGLWRFVHQGARCFAFRDGKGPMWPEGHLLRADAVAEAERWHP